MTNLIQFRMSSDEVKKCKDLAVSLGISWSSESELWRSLLNYLLIHQSSETAIPSTQILTPQTASAQSPAPKVPSSPPEEGKGADISEPFIDCNRFQRSFDVIDGYIECPKEIFKEKKPTGKVMGKVSVNYCQVCNERYTKWKEQGRSIKACKSIEFRV